ncbi:hypothetical protein JX266_001271 [Neoarthrinium moseri]|nr:hypothetical protein JX266_001271 [Neoarthrinium moseri]
MRALAGMIHGAITSFSTTLSTCCGWSDEKPYYVPYFEYPSPPTTPPQRVLTYSDDTDDGYSVTHKRSVSTLSFHIPRKPTNTGSVFDSPGSDVIRRPSPARLRPSTPSDGQKPGMEDLIERVATAMLERDRLQEQIEDVIERQSIYVSSRPSTANGTRPGTIRSVRSNADLEPMPEVPALPPNAPSFSERLSFDHPRAPPAKAPTYGSYRGRAFTEASHGSTSSGSSRRLEGRAPPPPLPLLLRPPLRKKKSFSRVSSWLGFPDDIGHTRNISLDSITNKPIPVQASDGFYQVAAPTRKASFESDETLSDWTSDGDALEEQTVPTSWSPSSSATVRAVDPPRTVVMGQAPFRESVVGVAF